MMRFFVTKKRPDVEKLKSEKRMMEMEEQEKRVNKIRERKMLEDAEDLSQAYEFVRYFMPNEDNSIQKTVEKYVNNIIRVERMNFLRGAHGNGLTVHIRDMLNVKEKVSQQSQIKRELSHDLWSGYGRKKSKKNK